MFADQLLIIGGLSLFAIIGGLLASKFKQPIALALMIVGAIIGPNVLGLLSDAAMIDLLIEFGAVLFLFGIGLEFSLKRLLNTGPSIVLVTAFKVGIMFFLGFTTTMILGFGVTAAAFVGVALSFSSTMIVLNVLKQQGLYRREEVQLIMGVLILEDIFGVIALTFLTSSPTGSIMEALIGIENLILGLLILAIVYILASTFAERIISWLTKNSGDETMIFISIGLCAGMALLAYLLGLSPGAGAFLAGSVASTFRQSREFERIIHPYSYIFTSFFFIGIGTMFNIRSVLTSLPVILVLGTTTVIGLQIAMGLSGRIFGRLTDNQAIFTSFAMLPPGIFSLLVAKEAAIYVSTLDLVSIVSTLMIFQTVLMALVLKHIIKVKLPHGITKRVEGVANNISLLYDGLKIETTHTRNYNRENVRLLTHLALILLPVMVLLRITHHVKHPALIVIAIIAVASTMAYGIFRVHQTDRILRKIILHNANRNAVRAFRQIQQGGIYCLIGLYSPLIIFLLNGNIFFLIPCVALAAFGIHKFLLAEDIIKGRARIKTSTPAQRPAKSKIVGA